MARVRLSLTELKASSLPPVCIICGEPALYHSPKLFSWRPRWLPAGFTVGGLFLVPPILLMLVGGMFGSWRGGLGTGVCLSPFCGLPMLLVLALSLFSVRRAFVECPMCERHRGYWAWRGFGVFAPLLALVVTVLTLGILLLLRKLPESLFGLMFVGTGLLLLVWGVFALIVQKTSLRADEITDDDIILQGVHSVFADMLRQRRGGSKALSDYGWREYDPYPRMPSK